MKMCFYKGCENKISKNKLKIIIVFSIILILFFNHLIRMIYIKFGRINFKSDYLLTNSESKTKLILPKTTKILEKLRSIS